MKKIKLLLVICLSAILLSACGQPAQPKSTITGKWENDDASSKFFIDFYDDGTFLRYGELYENLNGTYSIEDNVLTMTSANIPGGYLKYDFELNGSSLCLDPHGSYTKYYLTKVEDAKETQKAKNEAENETQNELVGQWEDDDNEGDYIEFFENGKYIEHDNDYDTDTKGTYTINGNVVLMERSSGSSFEYTFKINGTALQMTEEDWVGRSVTYSYTKVK